MAKMLWSQRQNMGPAARSGHAMAYDRGRKRTVLFGGLSGVTILLDTWEWDGQHWVQVADSGPTARQNPGMAHDENRSRVVLFGGLDITGRLTGDTWEWDGEFWVQVADTGPSPRSFFGISSDIKRKRITLFGGARQITPVAAPLGDTWEWDGDQWTQHEGVGPPARERHSLAYDPLRERTVLFGGINMATAALSADTWEWDGSTWLQVAQFGPTPRTLHQTAFDGSLVMLFGGITAGVSEANGETWEWDGKRWTLRRLFGPSPRMLHTIAFDDSRGRVVLFGGSADIEGRGISTTLGNRLTVNPFLRQPERSRDRS
jgi:hypothetical protein